MVEAFGVDLRQRKAEIRRQNATQAIAATKGQPVSRGQAAGARSLVARTCINTPTKIGSPLSVIAKGGKAWLKRSLARVAKGLHEVGRQGGQGQHGQQPLAAQVQAEEGNLRQDEADGGQVDVDPRPTHHQVRIEIGIGRHQPQADGQGDGVCQKAAVPGLPGEPSDGLAEVAGPAERLRGQQEHQGPANCTWPRPEDRQSEAPAVKRLRLGGKSPLRVNRDHAQAQQGQR